MPGIKGVFNENAKAYYNADIGGYTSMTGPEIQKGTFNVKACIRNVLVNKLGRERIPQYNEDGHMLFNLSEALSAKYNVHSISLSCKFCKQGKNEMSMYLSKTDFLPPSELNVGDVWCIYFKSNDDTPWFDCVSESQWNHINNSSARNALIGDTLIGDTVVEPDEIIMDTSERIALLTYDTVDVKRLTIHEVPAPSVEQQHEPVSPAAPSKRTIPVSEMKTILKNQKIKGIRGEEIVLRIEKERLANAGRQDLAEQVHWIAQDFDGYGYDIESFEYNPDTSNWEKIYIEVKSTSKSDKSTPFYISENELAVSKEIGSAYYIYRVFGMTKSGTDVSYYRINGSIEDRFLLHPCSYIASLK